MTFKEYLKACGTAILLNIVGMSVLIVYLMALNIPIWQIEFFVVGWIAILVFYNYIQFNKKKKYYDSLKKSIEMLDKKYLITEIIKEPESLEAGIFYNVLKEANTSMANEVLKHNLDRKSYQEYIEAIVHEVKNPIASISLMMKNHNIEIEREILDDLRIIEDYIEQALFYAKSDQLSKDYYVKQIKLQDVVRNVVKRNARLFIYNKISININDLDVVVYSDEKWLEFIIHQVISNSIRYTKESDKEIKIYSEHYSGGIALIIQDNGLGIKREEIDKVFNKGFTGTNGRIKEKSTGLGLYIIKGLCDGLGHGIKIESEVGNYTRVKVLFPKSEMTEI